MMLPKISKQSIAHFAGDRDDDNNDQLKRCFAALMNNPVLLKLMRNGIAEMPPSVLGRSAFGMIWSLFDYEGAILPNPKEADIQDAIKEYFVDFVTSHPICQRLERNNEHLVHFIHLISGYNSLMRGLNDFIDWSIIFLRLLEIAYDRQED